MSGPVSGNALSTIRRAVSLIAVIAAVSTGHVLAGCAGRPAIPVGGTPPSAVAGATQPSLASSETASAEPPGSDDHVEPVAKARVAAAPAAAAGFAAAWVRRDLPARQWLAGIRRWCEPHFAAALATVDPRNVPSHRVTGKPRTVRAPAARSAVYAVRTDTGTLTVTLADINGRWLVVSNGYRARP